MTIQLTPEIFHPLFLRLCYQPLNGEPSKNHTIKYMVDGSEHTLVTGFKFRSNMGQRVRRNRGEVTVEIAFEIIGLFQIIAEFDRPFAYTSHERHDDCKTLDYDEYLKISIETHLMNNETDLAKYLRKDIDEIVHQHLLILSLSQ